MNDIEEFANLQVVMLDNLDSFTYNLVDELRSQRIPVMVYRNTETQSTVIDVIERQAKHQPVVLLLSPGPGTPSAAGCMPSLLTHFAGNIPILGVCLGHQAIVEYFGGQTVRAPSLMHGKASLMSYQPHPIFTGLRNPLTIGRYHSLVATEVPTSVDVLATVDDLPMVVMAQAQRMLGFQFHPESIMTTQGTTLLINALRFLVNLPATANPE